MSDTGQETEAKFYVRDLERTRLQLQALKAHVIQARILETNIRFDLPGALLLSQGRVLRLRQDTDARLTYKSASTNEQGVLSRREIEFVVEDFEKAQQFLEALGYQKLLYYEKYRTTYQLDNNLVMLDELPYGNFVEIEGETIEAIRTLARQLNLSWKAAVGTSYTALFERTRAALNLSFQDLSFEKFSGIQVRPDDLGVQAAEEIT
jgi:adenylate cyclase class 2